MSLSVDAELEVPSPVSLEVHMTGGNLAVEGVEGDKNLQLFAGNLKVDVGTLESLRDAEVSVRAGDADVPSAGTLHGWLGHTWKYRGSGLYRLHAHTTFGDVSLVRSRGQQQPRVLCFVGTASSCGPCSRTPPHRQRSLARRPVIHIEFPHDEPPHGMQWHECV